MDLDELNITELLQLAQEENPNAHRGVSRDILVRIINGEEISLPPRKVDKTRLQIMEYINTYWAQVKPLVQGCPARTQDPRACFQCSDVQVVECALTNPQIFNRKSSE